jgi:hypothetical protein
MLMLGHQKIYAIRFEISQSRPPSTIDRMVLGRAAPDTRPDDHDASIETVNADAQLAA